MSRSASKIFAADAAARNRRVKLASVVVRQEPAERDQVAEVNDALDRIERDVAVVVAAGGEVPLRNRLARIAPQIFGRGPSDA